jgi:hypothetical protein
MPLLGIEVKGRRQEIATCTSQAVIGATADLNPDIVGHCLGESPTVNPVDVSAEW